MLRAVVTEGDRELREVPLQIGGKTGTAPKPGPLGGYLEDTVIRPLLASFPRHDPRICADRHLVRTVETSGDKRAAPPVEQPCPSPQRWCRPRSHPCWGYDLLLNRKQPRW